ncbi:MAG: ATP-binding cassette domain-containing protein [Verrucomicrobiales bacterium]|nr:ATP-binding cassette domain-containing protein [Verrucomicrobiales bacterium]
MSSPVPIIELDGVKRAYRMGDSVVKALDGVSITVNRGDYLCIMGPSGCGKSTMLNLLGCLDQPNEGDYVLDTENVSHLDDETLSGVRGRRLGFIFQSYNLIPQLTVLENIEVPLYYRGVSEQQSRKRALELAAKVGLADRVHHRPNELSGGQQQRVAIARALANDPPVILADEATGNLDSKSGEEILAIFAQLNREGKTLIFVTHDEEMAKRGNRILRLRDGKVESDLAIRDRPVGLESADALTSSPSTTGEPETLFPALNFKRTILLGLKSLWLHRLRSLLTALGIVFGVSSVIAMLAIGEGASFEAQEQIRKLGSQNVILRSVKPPGGSDSGEKRSFVLDYGISARDVRQIISTIPGIRMVVPNREIGDYVSHKTRRVDTVVSGVIPLFPEMRNRKLLKGRFFNLIEMEAKQNVCVISESVSRKLFPLSPTLGGDVKLGDTYYKVIGVLDSTEGLPGEEETGTREYEMYIPLETMLERFGEVIYKSRTGSFEAEKVEFHEVTVVVDDPVEVESKAEAIRHLLEANHDKPDFQVIVPVELLQQAERTKQIFTIVLGSIATISLIVGGIGIMNIMLASVTERTREIGIRRALGGRRQDITLQFLIEAVLLSGVGGLIGVALGLTVPALVTHFSGMVTVVKSWAPGLAFTISVLTGVVFGLYPALRASRLSPVDALRHE